MSVGIANTLFSYSVYAILLFIKVPFLVALLISTIVGVIFNYINFSLLVFNVNRNWLVFGKFVVSYALIYAVNAAFLRFLTVNLLLNPYFGQAICLPISVLLSWLLMNHWVYKNA
jgi:putative flippase GtrA